MPILTGQPSWYTTGGPEQDFGAGSQTNLQIKLKQKTFAYVLLNHMGALSSHNLHVIINKQAVLFLRALQHGVNTDESSRSANSSTGEIITALIKKMTLDRNETYGHICFEFVFLWS